MAKTKRSTIIENLERLGYKEVPNRSKYAAFKKSDLDTNSIFVGRNGAVRTGKVASKSFSLTSSKWVRENLLVGWGK